MKQKMILKMIKSTLKKMMTKMMILKFNYNKKNLKVNRNKNNNIFDLKSNEENEMDVEDQWKEVSLENANKD